MANRSAVVKMPQRPRAGEFLLGRQWYMKPDALKGLRLLAEKRLAEPGALTAWADEPAPNAMLATVRDGIATIQINGPMERTWGFWSWLYGSPTYEMLAVEMQRLRDNSAIRATVLAFDTPGGMVNGCGELAGIIRACDAVKPVYGHVPAECCSAGYYLASATRRVFADDAAIVGCIGTCATFIDTTGFEEQLGIEFIEMVSSQTPRKNADPTTEAGRNDWQALLDSLAGIFIRDVAAYRGVDEATVLEDFGQGGVFVGQEAIDAGLADALGTTESVHEAVLAALNSPDTEDEPMPAAARTRATPKAKTTPAPAARRTRAEADTPEDDEDDEEEAKAKESTAAAEEDGDDEEEDDEEEQSSENKATKKKATTSAEQQHAAAIAAVPANVAAHFRSEGATQERERILGIYGLSAKMGGTPKATKMITDGMKDPSATKATVSVAMVEGGLMAGASILSGRQADEDDLDPPSNADNPAATASEDASLVQRIANTYNTHRRSRSAAARRN
jgi:ClpP class serine protease